ncbi:MAG: Holliday junction branch migration protein RuvA [Firmicutes bacterium]|nr:Holliday junction branch migration protein RuvA [Bacillota bacterium]MDY5531461.1 Holliday junction branch migration protein RuvA [Pumilibacteraceae bacterium]
MFDYISGKKIKATAGKMVVDNSGIGYLFFVSDKCISALSGSENVKIYTYLSVREDDVSLFGFYSEEERAMFEKLISISGIGPKVAMAVLSEISAGELAGKIISADTKALNKIKGVGKKTAERIVLELKDKVGKEFSAEQPDEIAENFDEQANDAVMALMTLGFTRKEAENKVAKVDKTGLSPEEVVFMALKNG